MMQGVQGAQGGKRAGGVEQPKSVEGSPSPLHQSDLGLQLIRVGHFLNQGITPLCQGGGRDRGGEGNARGGGGIQTFHRNNAGLHPADHLKISFRFVLYLLPETGFHADLTIICAHFKGTVS